MIAIVQALNVTTDEGCTEMTETVALFLRVSPELKADLEMTASLQRRSMTFVANDLLRAGLDKMNAEVDQDLVNLVKMARNIA